MDSQMQSEAEFRDQINDLLNKIHQEKTSLGKIPIAIEVFELTRNNMYLLVKDIQRWHKFIITVFNKCVEFEKEYREGKWLQFDKELVDKLVEGIYKTKDMTMNIMKVRSDEGYSNYVPYFRETIQLAEATRPYRRSAPRVNYTGLDTIEPECEDDHITNIWEDLTREEDSDYEYEQDYDDDEVVIPLNDKEKTDLKTLIETHIDNSEVYYTPDYNELLPELPDCDSNLICLRKKHIVDGKATFVWYTYSL